MNESMKLLEEKFNVVKEMGYVKSTRGGTTGVGKTFEDLIGKKEDRSPNPDFYGVEIKTKLYYSIRNTTLFNLNPKGKEQYETRRLVKTYGYPDKDLPEHKVLYATVYGSCLNCIAAKFLMGLSVDYENERIILRIINLNMELVENYVYWDFEELKERLYRKLKYLAVVNAAKKTINGDEYYHYTSIDFYKMKDFSTFLKLVEIGIVCVTFRIGIEKYGPRKGEFHDRGTSFQIKECNLTKLFDKIED